MRSGLFVVVSLGALLFTAAAFGTVLPAPTLQTQPDAALVDTLLDRYCPASTAGRRAPCVTALAEPESPLPRLRADAGRQVRVATPRPAVRLELSVGRPGRRPRNVIVVRRGADLWTFVMPRTSGTARLRTVYADGARAWSRAILTPVVTGSA